MLDPVEEPLDQIPDSIEIGPEADQFVAIAPWRDVGPCAFLGRKASDPVRIIASVREQYCSRLHLSAQFFEELPHICHHRLGLLPEREMASTRHLGVVNQIEISLQCASWRVE